jgi:hypothetical protein
MKARKALISYVSFWLGRRIVERIIHRQVKRKIIAFLEPPKPSKTRRRLPLVGAAVALAAAAAAVVLTRQRSWRQPSGSGSVTPDR